MDRQEIIERFCRLSAEVMARKFEYKIPADCFCEKYEERGFQFSEEIIDFIEKAVEKELDNETSL